MSRGPSVLALIALLAACGRVPDGARPEPLTVADLLGGAPDPAFARADAPRRFDFPADHGPHPAYRTEWWYLTGNLADRRGDAFGYQLTFFRQALVADPPDRDSAWATRDVAMAHFAVTDAAAGRFHAHERFSRMALGLAGARGEPLAVWLEDWRLEQAGPVDESTGTPPLRLRAAAGDAAIDLRLDAARPPVLQGDRGLSRKGSVPGNASYYYSLPRLATRGVLTVDGRAREVAGTSWLDREWSTVALEPGQVGWDWFALGLDDGRDLMLYRLRRADGSTDPASAGSLIAEDGTVRPLAAADFAIRVLDHWTSPHRPGAVRYPASWELTVPRAGLRLKVVPLLADQEHRGAVRYWEGAVGAAGTASGRQVAGWGYVELTGYDGACCQSAATAPAGSRMTQ